MERRGKIMETTLKIYLSDNGYKKVRMTKAIQKELPCGIETLNCISSRYYMFSTVKGKIAYGMFNYFIENGAFFTDEKGKLNVDKDKIYPAVSELATKLLTIEAMGDYQAAKQLIEKYRQMTPLMQKLINDLKHVPVDIRPSFPVLNELKELN